MCFYSIYYYIFFIKDVVCLFIYLERSEEREKEGEKHCCARETSISYRLHTPSWGPGPQPRPGESNW